MLPAPPFPTAKQDLDIINRSSDCPLPGSLQVLKGLTQRLEYVINATYSFNFSDLVIGSIIRRYRFRLGAIFLHAVADGSFV